MQNVDMDSIIRATYRAAIEEPVDHFADWCFGLVKRHINFSSGLWAYLSSGDRRNSHALHLYNLEDHVAECFEYHKRSDPLFGLVVESEGKTINSCDWTGRKKTSHSRLYDRVSALSMMVPTGPANLCGMIAFFTGKCEPFAETDRVFVQQLIPHFIEAAQINRVARLNPAPEPGRGDGFTTAVCDSKGVLHCEPGLEFASIMEREWPQWQGPMLPPALCANLLDATCGNYQGEYLIARSERYCKAGFFKVFARQRGPDDALAPRELDVAKLLAKGLTYKEVAKVLEISPSTVTNHANNIYQKLQIRNKAQLASVIRA